MTITKQTAENIVTAILLSLAAIMFFSGCESRTVTYSTPDGRSLTYQRISIIGDSSSEGVSVSRDGDDLTVDVGATGSKARVEVLGAVVEALK